jgi:outer membrane protein TolC
MIRSILIATLAATASLAQTYATNGDPQLDVYIRDAVERNPTVRQVFQKYQASLERLPQVSALPEPMLGVTQYTRAPETRVGPQTTMLTISQQFPWFGKLNDREKIAAKEAEAFREHYEAQQDEVIRQVKLAYYSLAFIDRAITITGEDLSLLQQYETLAQARYSQGQGLQQSVIKLQAEITRDQNRLDELRRQRVEAEAMLNTVMDRPANSPVLRVAILTRPPAAVDYESLHELATRVRPEVLGALLQIERDEKRIQLAKKSYWPDFSIGASFTNVNGRSDLAGVMNPPDQNGKNIYAISATINIPIRRRKYDAAIQEATEDQLAAREGYRSVVNSVEGAVRGIGFRIETLKEQIALFENTLLPQAEQALASTEAAYSTGTLGVLDLLDSERFLLNMRLGLAQYISDYMKSLAEMERAIGAPYPEVTP